MLIAFCVRGSGSSGKQDRRTRKLRDTEFLYVTPRVASAFLVILGTKQGPFPLQQVREGLGVGYFLLSLAALRIFTREKLRWLHGHRQSWITGPQLLNARY